MPGGNTASPALDVLPDGRATAPSPAGDRLRAFFTSPYTLTAIFFVLCLVRTLAHVMWRDELQAWMIARESHSLAELFYNARYEGHPALWFLMLYPLTRVSENPVLMQLLHVIGATAVVWVVARRAPFSPLLKWLFAFGYFPFFEYGVVSRTYAFGVLLFFIACAMMTGRRKDDRVAIACVLFLLCQTTAFGIMLAIALAMTYAVELIVDRRAARTRPRMPRPARPLATALAAIIVIGGIALAVWQMLPPPDNSIVHSSVPTRAPSRAVQVLAGVWYAYIPIRMPDAARWKDIGKGIQFAQAAGAIPLFVLAMLVVARSPSAAFLLLCGTLGQLAFKYRFHPGATRHHGHLFILFVGAFWLRNADVIRVAPSIAARGALDWFDRRRNALVALLFVVHALAGLAAGGLDLVRPFSASKAVARYIQAQYGSSAILVGDDDVMTSAVAGHLGREIYYPARGEFGSYIKWDSHRKKGVPRLELFAQVKRLRATHGSDVPIVLVLTAPITKPVTGLDVVGHFDRSTRPEERYYLYRVTGDPAFTVSPAASSRPSIPASVP
jgi:hypothetical protein